MHAGGSSNNLLSLRPVSSRPRVQGQAGHLYPGSWLGSRRIFNLMDVVIGPVNLS